MFSLSNTMPKMTLLRMLKLMCRHFLETDILYSFPLLARTSPEPGTALDSNASFLTGVCNSFLFLVLSSLLRLSLALLQRVWLVLCIFPKKTI